MSLGPTKHKASSSRFLNITWKVHPEAKSRSTTDVNLLELNHNRKTIARKSETAQLPQPEDSIPPPQPIYDPIGSHDTDLPSPLVTFALRRDIFLADAFKPTVRSPTPIHPQARIESTLQLVFCARLLLEDQQLSTSQSSPTGVCVLDDAGRRWFDAIQGDPPAQARIHWLVSRLVTEFLKDPAPGPEAIFEVVVLGPVLCQVDYRTLLSGFIERFDDSALLNVNLLQGMIQLLQSAPSGGLTDDDLVRIVSSIRKRLESTHAPDRVHVYQLVVAVSKVLEVMVRGEVKGLNRQRDHQSLLATLCNLKGVNDDEFLKFQAYYAYQMLLYLPDDETSFQAFWRYAESVAVGVSAVASVFKLDPLSALAAVEHIQQVAGNAIDVVKFSIDGARAFQSTAGEATQAAEKTYWSQKKQPWFLALQAGCLFVQDGRLVDFNILVCDATRRFDVNFQRGVCQILGEVALSPLWDDGSRRSAIDFLGELCKTDAGLKKDVMVRKWVATILQQISSSASPDISGYARTLLDDLLQEQTLDIQECRALYTPLPIPTAFPLLERALEITDIDHELACIRFRSLEECLHPVSIPLRAKATLLAPKGESFPLMAKVQEFLRSDNLVFLLLGDSGSGKSIFCRQLERELWGQYQNSDSDRVPLYINLPSIDDPHCGLIEKYLQHQHDILEPFIQKIKHRRQFVLICDGYDESRLFQNLHTSNRFNRPGQWSVKIIITCRSTFISHGYQDNFRPLGDDKYHDNSSRLFEEATIVPFSKNDIQEFVKQYVLDGTAQGSSDNPPAISFDDYWEKLSAIPNLMSLVSNPFLLTLALKAIPSRSIKALDFTELEAMQHDLYDSFIQEWVRLHQKRLQGTILEQNFRAAFDILLRDGFSWCVTDYLKRLADAIYQYQDGNPVVKFSRWYMEEWKVKFFGPEIETTLLREASPLARAGTRHWFLHKSLLDYFYARTFFDPDDSDDDDSNDGDDGDDDSRGGGDDFHSGRGNSLNDGGDSGDSAGGYRGSTGGNAESTGGNGGSSGGNGGSSGGNGGSTSGDQDSPGGGGNSSGGSSGGSYGSNNEGSRGDKNDPNGDEDGSHSRLEKRLFAAIEQSKTSSVPSLAAANAITILFKSGKLFQDAVMDSVPIPSDYMSMAMGRMELAQLPESNLTGGDLMKVLMTPTIPASAPIVTATALAVPVSATTVPALMPFSTTIAQKTPTASLRPSSHIDSPNPDQAIPLAPEDADGQEMLDNPDLVALVEYKWNTIVFNYWRARFLCQCCIFLLVLVTVLMQAYSNALQSSEALYIAIISCSAVFLCVEFIQCLKGWARYFNSIRNLAVPLAFGFPLAAAINQLLILREITSSEGVATQVNAVLFGTSALLLSLYFILELRVLETVSQYVAIITRIIGRNLVLFIGGRYDPITDDLDSDNRAFLMLMIAGFFLTIILMLNVLVALLNVGFDTGDVKWPRVRRRNRIRVVESAENMSHQIPGSAPSRIPEEIYYSASHEQSKAYKMRWVPESEGEDEYVLQHNGAQAVILPEEAGVEKTAINYSMSGPATPDDALQSDLDELMKLRKISSNGIFEKLARFRKNRSQKTSGLGEWS
ncbi:hypothetical protein BGX24_002217 [Mortierella sp. AD032]|nr:hypothetical protein BGX24_002217 [Mortierella sp. AD032]